MSDLDAYAFVRRGDRLVPADINADDFLKSVQDGREILIKAHAPRHPEFHRWFFAMLHKVCEAVEGWEDEDELLDALKHEVGYVRTVRRLDGEFYRRPKSISFAAMGEDRFRRFVARCLYVLNQHFGIDGEALMEEVDREQGTNIAKRNRAA